MILDLTDDEKLALAGLPKRVIAADRFPLSPRVRTLHAILDKIEPPGAGYIKAVPGVAAGRSTSRGAGRHETTVDGVKAKPGH